MSVVDDVAPSGSERVEARPGDQLVAAADVVMDRAFTVDGSPAEVWPWIVQLGKARAGWYFSRRIELLIPAGHRAIRHVEPRWQGLVVGDDIPDYGGGDASFTVDEIDAPHTLVYRSKRGRTTVSWSIVLRPAGASTRVLLRLRLAPVRHERLAGSVGGLFDILTIAGMAAGLRERVSDAARASGRVVQ